MPIRVSPGCAKGTLAEDDANNILYRFEASHDCDIVGELDRIRSPLLNIMFADDG